jgi:hypothetical protein
LDIPLDTPVMSEEIFGPILPIIIVKFLPLVSQNFQIQINHFLLLLIWYNLGFINMLQNMILWIEFETYIVMMGTLEILLEKLCWRWAFSLAWVWCR